MKLVIVGGVAAGATAAARARRLDENAEITIVERGPYVSFANCGLPYRLSGDIQKRSSLILQTPEGFFSRYRVKVLLKTEAVAIDRDSKLLKLRSPEGESNLPYDALILAQGGSPFVPPVEGIEFPNVFRLWTIPDMDAINNYIKDNNVESAVVVGGGFIGLKRPKPSSSADWRPRSSNSQISSCPRRSRVRKPYRPGFRIRGSLYLYQTLPLQDRLSGTGGGTQRRQEGESRPGSHVRRRSPQPGASQIRESSHRKIRGLGGG